MSAQFDFDPGFDLSSVASYTQAQLQQALSQLAPILNIGGVIFQAGPSLASTLTAGVLGAPDVANNPRFKRYMWLNTYDAANNQPTPYFYAVAGANAGKWVSVTVAAGSITNTEIAAAANIVVTKLLKDTARYLIRTNAAGSAVEWVAPASIFNAAELPVADLVPAGGGSYLKTTGGISAWVDDATERAAIIGAITALAVAVLSPGANGAILTTIAGSTVWALPAVALPAGSAIPTGALAASGATAARQVLGWSGTAWEPETMSLQANSSSPVSTIGLTGSNLNVAGATIAHGLAAVPKLIRVVAKCILADATSTASQTYNVGDEVELSSLESAGSFVPFGVSADATNVYIGARSNAAIPITIKSKLGTVVPGGIDEINSWVFWAYAWK